MNKSFGAGLVPKGLFFCFVFAIKTFGSLIKFWELIKQPGFEIFWELILPKIKKTLGFGLGLGLRRTLCATDLVRNGPRALVPTMAFSKFENLMVSNF